MSNYPLVFTVQTSCSVKFKTVRTLLQLPLFMSLFPISWKIHPYSQQQFSGFDLMKICPSKASQLAFSHIKPLLIFIIKIIFLASSNTSVPTHVLSKNISVIFRLEFNPKSLRFSKQQREEFTMKRSLVLHLADSLLTRGGGPPQFPVNFREKAAW